MRVRLETGCEDRTALSSARKLPPVPSSQTYAVLMVALLLIAGCSSRDRHRIVHGNDYWTPYTQELANKVEFPTEVDDVHVADPYTTAEPRTLKTGEPPEHWVLPLNTAILRALQNSKVMRDLGGSVLRSPETVRTRFDTAIQLTDPRFGQEAALSAFDATFSTRANFENNDRALNNVFFGGGTTMLKQDLNVYQTELSKRSAIGTLFSARYNTQYDANNAPGNVFPHAWDTMIEVEARQPLLRGGGLQYNRIAGPNGIPGINNGVLIARVDNDITQTEFELGLRSFVSDVVNAYWELYFAYRDLDAKIDARDAALEKWLQQKADKDRVSKDRVALSAEQFYRFQQEVENSLSGRQVEGTRTTASNGAGTLRNAGGVYVAERRLRLLMGEPISDNRLIRPSDEPDLTPIEFDWDAAAQEALVRRPELKRQRLRVKRREMDLIAAQNYLSPRLDAVAGYRWRGFGKDFLDTNGSNIPRFDNAVDNLVSGDFQEWQIGFEFVVPIGFRRAHANVQNSELALAKERAILREQEREVIYNLSNAASDVDRAFQVAQTNLNRFGSAKELLDSLEANERTGRAVDLDRLLDAQRRKVDSEIAYFRSRVEFVLALKNLNYEKGSLFDYYELFLQDSGAMNTPGVSHVSPGLPIDNDGQPRPAPPSYEEDQPAPPAEEVEQPGAQAIDDASFEEARR